MVLKTSLSQKIQKVPAKQEFAIRMERIHEDAQVTKKEEDTTAVVSRFKNQDI
jgi:hypothetical protein